MAEFLPAVEILLKHEGGYAPSDNNRGSVRYGWTEKSLRDLGLPDRPETLTRERAMTLYCVWFWHRSRCDEIRDQRLATLYFSMTVNSGPDPAARCLQMALRDLGAEVVVDGIVGRKTLKAVNEADAAALIERYKAHLLARYARLAHEKPELYADDLPGWKARLETL